ncbi:MAG: tRNA (adenosine(37)-N6)-threonylcarbamoyltransferase complex ATPase subunit type 1 TsaE [Candidatus Saccharibacteria bacterium]
MFIEVKSEKEMQQIGAKISAAFLGGEIIELIGDIGSGKTTLTKGIAVGLGVTENVQSPSFTINRVYEGHDGITLSHYDFYRLNDAGIMADELQEVTSDQKTVTVIEWAGVVEGVLPIDRLSIKITSPTENTRQLELIAGGENSRKILEGLKL